MIYDPDFELSKIPGLHIGGDLDGQFLDGSENNDYRQIFVRLTPSQTARGIFVERSIAGMASEIMDRLLHGFAPPITLYLSSPGNSSATRTLGESHSLGNSPSDYDAKLDLLLSSYPSRTSALKVEPRSSPA